VASSSGRRDNAGERDDTGRGIARHSKPDENDDALDGEAESSGRVSTTTTARATMSLKVEVAEICGWWRLVGASHVKWELCPAG
jgi:hypothetical protein